MPEGAGQDLTLQAEDAHVVGATVALSIAGYTGSGYVAYTHATSDSVERTLNSSSGGSRRFDFRYANGSGSTRALQLTLNGSVIASPLNFPATGAWSPWRTVSIDVPVVAGQNTVRLATNGVQGPNLDSLVVKAAPSRRRRR